MCTLIRIPHLNLSVNKLQITNQTLSQSVPPSVITTINGYTKVFIGLLVERARSIQQQEATPPPTPPTHPTFHLPLTNDPSPKNPSFDGIHHSGDGSAPHNPNGIDGASLSEDKSDNSSGNKPAQPPRYLGPLLPDHLREALRRYKRDGEGDGTGMGSWSLGLGLPGKAAARRGGRRMFL